MAVPSNYTVGNEVINFSASLDVNQEAKSDEKAWTIRPEGSPMISSLVLKTSFPLPLHLIC